MKLSAGCHSFNAIRTYNPLAFGYGIVCVDHLTMILCIDLILRTQGDHFFRSSGR